MRLFHSNPVSRGILALIFIVAAGAAQAAKPEVYMDGGGLFGTAWTHAVGGYDTVAYFTEGKPVQGKDEFTTEYKGVNWRFASQENLDKFKANPDQYRPQYGGYCAYAVANGGTAKGEPEVWHIHEGKLYLNVSKSVQRRWLKDVPGYITKANTNWPGVLN